MCKYSEISEVPGASQVEVLAVVACDDQPAPHPGTKVDWPFVKYINEVIGVYHLLNGNCLFGLVKTAAQMKVMSPPHISIQKMSIKQQLICK